MARFHDPDFAKAVVTELASRSWSFWRPRSSDEPTTAPRSLPTTTSSARGERGPGARGLLVLIPEEKPVNNDRRRPRALLAATLSFVLLPVQHRTAEEDSAGTPPLSSTAGGG